jgi:hypothetical protein
MQKQISSGSRRLGAVLMLAGALVFLALGAALTWIVWVAKAPGLEALSQTSGRVQGVESTLRPQTGRTVRLTIDQAGSFYALRIPRSEHLPARDWPLGSLDPGDRVVAWYLPDEASPSSGTIWQLFRGRQHVVMLEDTAAAHSSRARRPLPWIVLGLVAGAVLVAFGRILYRRAGLMT